MQRNKFFSRFTPDAKHDHVLVFSHLFSGEEFRPGKNKLNDNKREKGFGA